MDVHKDLYVVFIVCTLALCTGIASKLINDEVSEPYMDEQFHVNQTQKYCLGLFHEWDSKITTFPGLYFVATAIGWVTRRCDLVALRFLNASFTIACFPLFYFLSLTTNPSQHTYALIKASACCLFPVHFFHGLLYYTDTVSVFFVFFALLAGLHGWRGTRFIASLISIAMRQTNSVWVGFILGCCVLKKIDPSLVLRHDDGENNTTTRKKMKSTAASRPRHKTQQQQQQLEKGDSFCTSTIHIITQVWNDKYNLILTQSWEMIALLLAFAAFVVWNSGVVIGDKSNHTISVHLMQPLYLLAYIAAALAPFCWSIGAVVQTLEMIIKHPQIYITSAAVTGVMVYRYTLVHPFMLADNRHIVFYIWRRIINYRWWSRYALIPVYLHSATVLLLHTMAVPGKRRGRKSGEEMKPLRSHPSILLLLWWVCSAVVLVPSQLLELRYFTVPALIAFLMLIHVNGNDRKKVVMMVVVAGWAMVDIVTVWVFLYRPFIWGDGSVARFVW